MAQVIFIIAERLMLIGVLPLLAFSTCVLVLVLLMLITAPAFYIHLNRGGLKRGILPPLTIKHCLEKGYSLVLYVVLIKLRKKVIVLSEELEAYLH